MSKTRLFFYSLVFCLHKFSTRHLCRIQIITLLIELNREIFPENLYGGVYMSPKKRIIHVELEAIIRKIFCSKPEEKLD